MVLGRFVPCHPSLVCTPHSVLRQEGWQRSKCSCFPIDLEMFASNFLIKNDKKIYMDVIWSVKEFPRWFQGPCLTLPLWPDFDLKTGHFWPPRCTQEKDGRGQSGPKSCLPIDIDVIWGVKEFPLWFQGPWMTLPLWPDFDLKNCHFWPPCAHEGWMAGVRVAPNHVFLLI